MEQDTYIFEFFKCNRNETVASRIESKLSRVSFSAATGCTVGELQNLSNAKRNRYEYQSNRGDKLRVRVAEPLTTVGSRLEDRGINGATFMVAYAYEIVLDLLTTAPQSGSDKYFVSCGLPIGIMVFIFPSLSFISISL